MTERKCPFAVGDMVRITGEHTSIPHGFDAGDECEIITMPINAPGDDADEREAFELRILTGRRNTQWVHPADFVLVRKAGE